MSQTQTKTPTYAQIKKACEAIGLQFLIAYADEDEMQQQAPELQEGFSPLFFPSEPYKMKNKVFIGKQVFHFPSCIAKDRESVIQAIFPALLETGLLVDVYTLPEWPQSPERFTYKWNPEDNSFQKTDSEIMNFGEHQ